MFAVTTVPEKVVDPENVWSPDIVPANSLEVTLFSAIFIEVTLLSAI